jgi:hypothetical protein
VQPVPGALQRTGQLGTYAPILGQEAIQAGIGSAMRADDVFLMTYLRRHRTSVEIPNAFRLKRRLQRCQRNAGSRKSVFRRTCALRKEQRTRGSPSYVRQRAKRS